MKLVCVDAEFPEDKMASAIALFEEQASAVRAMEGCTHYALYQAPDSPVIAIVQRWDSMEALDAYRGSNTFATLGQELKPMMTKPPVTTIAEIDG